MKPAIHDGLVLYAPMDHPERIAAGMADLNELVLRYEPPVASARWPFRKLALHAVGLVFGLSALCAVLGVLAS